MLSGDKFAKTTGRLLHQPVIGARLTSGRPTEAPGWPANRPWAAGQPEGLGTDENFLSLKEKEKSKV